MMMNNPVMAMLAAMRNGANPTAILQQMSSTNPQARQVVQLMNGKNPDQLRKIAENLAANQGTSIEDVARSLGISVPSNR